MQPAILRHISSRTHIFCAAILMVGHSSLLAFDDNSPAPTDCAEIDGADALIKPGVFLIVGEMHGTQESPEAVGDLVCMALKRGLAVTLGLEIPTSQQVLIDEILGEPDQEKALARLRESEFFKRNHQDGRSSKAMADLILRCRRFSRDGGDVRLTCFDSSDGETRDQAMAKRLIAERGRHKQRTTLVLTGNVHARKTKNPRFNFTPMGVYLAEADVSFVSVNAIHAGGSAWVCQPNQPCGVLQIGGEDHGAKRFVKTEGEIIPHGYDTVLYVGRVTASKPLD